MYYIRSDLPKRPSIQALANHVSEVERRTVLEGDGFIINTVEHLLAALYSQGIDNAICEINTEELPVLDGSAKEYIDMIIKVGRKEQDALRKVLILKKNWSFLMGKLKHLRAI